MDWHWTKMRSMGTRKWKYRQKVEVSQRAGGNAAPSVSIFAEISITHGWCDQTEEQWKGVGRSNKQRAGDR